MTLLALAGSALLACGLPIVQEWYVPQPEAQLRADYLVLAPNTNTTCDSVIAITVPIAGTTIVLDHWEDGYEVDLANPIQAATRIWGDGNDANGIPPGFTHDPASFSAGSVIIMRNNVTLPRNAATILYDGRDRFGSTYGMVMTRAAWFTTPGPLLANSVEVRAVPDWGTAFELPIGEDVIFPAPLTSSMFEHCSAYIMAAANGTVVTIDKDGPGAGAATTVTLNQGESYLVNSGIKKGATIASTKGVQVIEFFGDIGANYESRGANVPPLNRWSDDYYAPVGTASDGDDTYVFLYNPDASATLAVNYVTKAGSGSFAIAPRDTYRFLMPQNSTAHFTSVGNKPFWGVATVGAEPTANNVHDWGYSLVPKDFLSTEIVVGWGAGSTDNSVDGNPVWVTATTATTIYVDDNGDHLGSLIDPNGNRYDRAIVVTPLTVTRIYEPDKNQTGMRLYTLNGALMTGAWGQDPAVAGPALPYLDLGNTLPNFPVPVLSKTSRIFTDNGAAGLSVGDVVEYTLTLDNRSLFSLSAVGIVDALPTSYVTYVAGSTTRDGTAVADSASGTPFPLDEGLVVPILQANASTVVKFRVTITAAGTIANTASVVGSPGVQATDTIVVPLTGGSTACTLTLTNSSGTEVNYSAGDGVYVTVTDGDANTSATTAQTMTALVENPATGDAELITLSETGVASGVFRNTSALASSTTTGLGLNDGTLNVQPGNTINASHVDSVYGDTCPDTATISAPAGLSKYLYLNSDGGDGDATGGLDRVDPVATADPSISQTTALDPWYHASWLYRKRITIDHTKVPNTDQVNFPVVINLASDSGLSAHALTTGNDILFTASDGTTILSYEREKYTGGTGALVAWVKVPTLSHTVDTVLYLYYGNSTAADQQNKSAVWDANFKLVYHLGDAGPTSAFDSTATGNNGTATGASFGAAGQLDGAASFSNGNTTPLNYIASGSAPALSANGSFSYEMWLKVTGSYVNNPDTASSSGTWFLDRTGVTFPLVSLMPVGSGQFGYQTRYDDDSGLGGPSGGTITTGVWSHIVMVRDYNKAFRLYVNGTQVGTMPDTGSKALTPPIPKLGRHANFTVGTPGLNGLMDEFRISSGARSADWIKTEYNNQSSPATFYSLGAESGGFSTATFTQSPAFTAAFSLTAAPSVSAYYTGGSGSMPASPNISAVLRNNGTAFATSSSASAAGGLLTFTFPTPASPVTFAANDVMSVVFTNNQPGVTFTLDYDSSTKPSKISLPTNTVIQTDSVEFFDAPYPGGSRVTPTLTQTLYVRATVMDPFGQADITSATLGIDGPGTAGDVATTPMTVVSGTGYPKIYEYKWLTGVAEGNFTLTATANEGYETPVISSTKLTTVSLTAQDLGTPSITEFTTGNNGPHALNYAPNEQVFVRLTDLDQNTNPLVAESLTVSVTGSGGDTETVTLTETGPSTGIFTGGIPASSTVAGSSGDHTLHALRGSVPVVNYVDPTDPIDTGSDSAIIPNTSPGIAVTKTLLAPADGQIVIGEAAQYRLGVTNNGNTTLNAVQVVDTYAAAGLTYVSATPAPTSTTSGTLTWANVGPLTPGQSVDIIVNFTGLAAANPATNSVNVTTGGGPTASASRDVIVTRPAVTVTKTLYSPSSGPAAKGSNVVFDISVRNTGTSVIDTLPLEDIFSDALFDYVSATVTPDGAGAGSLLWNDLTGAGGLAASATTSVRVTLRAKGAATLATNSAVVSYAVDANGDAVPPSSSSAGVQTTAAAISGKVCEEHGTAGFSGDDVGIEGATVKLYSDPNNDGNPADGALVAVTTSDSTGYYEFLNLAAGHYVVVEVDQAGNFSVADRDSTSDNPGNPTDAANTSQTDNLLPVDLAAGETDSGNDFLDGVVVSSFGKTVDKSVAGVGETLTYTLSPEYSGAALLNSATLTDVLPAGTTLGTITQTGAVSKGTPLTWTLGGNSAAVNGRTSNMVSGSYTGNGVDDRYITGLGFQPALVIIKSSTTTQNAVARSATFAGDVSKDMAGEAAPVANLIQNLQADGFQVGTDARVNADTVVYHYVAFKAVAGEVATGTYRGTGDVLPVTGVGFAPTFLLTMGNGDRAAGWKTSQMSTGSSGVSFETRSAAQMTNAIRSLDADGFTLDSSNPDEQNSNGETYNYIAFKAVTGKMQTGSFTGNGSDNRNLTGIGFQPDFVWMRGNATNTGETVFKGGSTGTGTDATQSMSNLANFADGIQALQADGFQVGTSIKVNANNKDTYWAAFKGTGATTTTLAVDKRLVTDPDPASGTVGANVVVTMTVGSDTALTGVVPPTLTPTMTLGTAATATLTSGTPPNVNIAAGGTATFTWTYRLDVASAAASWKENLTFSGAPTHTSATFGAATSPSVIVTQPLKFTAIVTSPAAANTVTNQAQVLNNGTLLGLSPRVLTTLQGSITGTVKADTNDDDSGDANLTGVTVTLCIDPNGDGDPADGVACGSPVITGVDGSYAFTHLPAGNYVVVETDLSGYQSVSDDAGSSGPSDGPVLANANDNRILVTLGAGAIDTGNNFVDEQYGTVTGLVMVDTDHNNTGDTALSGVALELRDATTAALIATTHTDGAGSYTFPNVAPGDYKVAEIQPAGYGSVFDRDTTFAQYLTGGNANLIGDVTLIRVDAGATNAGNDFLEIRQACPDRWEDWRSKWSALGVSDTTLTGNPDLDRYNNLIEYAFCLPPNSGALKPFCLRLSDSGKIDGVFRRTARGTTDVTYDLQWSPSLTAASWTSIPIIFPPAGNANVTVTDDGDANNDGLNDGTETIRILDLEDKTGLRGLNDTPAGPGRGFVRMAVTYNNQTTAYAEVLGWSESVLGTSTPATVRCRTYNNPYLHCAVFTGTGSSVSGQDFTLATSLGSLSIPVSAIPDYYPYYLEVTSGTNQGQRFDIVSASGTTVTVATDTDSFAGTPPFSTLAGALPSLNGDSVVIRPHWTLEQMFPVTGFQAATSQTDADQVQTYANGIWTTYYLYLDGSSRKWVRVGSDLTNQGNAVIPPGQGMFVNRVGEEITLLAYGEVRDNDFKRPLCAGYNLVGGGFPIDQSVTDSKTPAVSRRMNLAAGFFGSRDFKTADSFCVWQGDATSGANNGYDTYYLLNNTSPAVVKWVKVGDAGLAARDAAGLMLSDRSVFIRVKNSLPTLTSPTLPTYTIPRPWTP